MSQICDIEAQADIFGTYRVTVIYRAEDGLEREPLVVHGVERWAVEQMLLALVQDSPTDRRSLHALLDGP